MLYLHTTAAALFLQTDLGKKSLNITGLEPMLCLIKFWQICSAVFQIKLTGPRPCAIITSPNRMLISVVTWTASFVQSDMFKNRWIDFGNFSQQMKPPVSVPAKWVCDLGKIVNLIKCVCQTRSILLFFQRFIQNLICDLWILGEKAKSASAEC